MSAQARRACLLSAQARRADRMAAVAPRATVCVHLCSQKPEGLTQIPSLDEQCRARAMILSAHSGLRNTVGPFGPEEEGSAWHRAS